MEKEILFRVVIEVIGKPQEHVKTSMQGYLENLKQNDRYQVVREDIAAVEEREKEMWATFAELEVKAGKILDVVAFCFEYMPSMVEIITPKEITFSDADFSMILNELQARLHQVDFVAKHVKLENDMLKNNTTAILKNYITVLLRNNRMTSEQLSRYMGVDRDKLEDFLDQLIDEGRVDLDDDHYYLKPQAQPEQAGPK